MTTECIAGIVLCGGQSRRMGVSKADLLIDGKPLLVRTVSTVSMAADPVVVAAGPDQSIPPLPESVRIVRDSRPNRGPLSAFAEAIAALPIEVEWTYLVGCDMPFLSPDYLRFIAGQPRNADAVVPFVENRWHPLAGIYRRGVKSIAEKLVREGRPRMLDLLNAISVTPVGTDELLKLDPGLRCLRNVNTPEEFAAALRERRSRDRVTRP